MEKKNQEPSAGGAAAQKPETHDNGNKPHLTWESDESDMMQGKKRLNVFQPAGKKTETGKIEFAQERKKLNVPALVLLSSLAALIAGIFLYCRSAGSDGLITCLLELIGF